MYFGHFLTNSVTFHAVNCRFLSLNSQKKLPIFATDEFCHSEIKKGEPELPFISTNGRL